MKTTGGFEITDVISCRVRALDELGRVQTFHLHMEQDQDRIAAAFNILRQCERPPLDKYEDDTDPVLAAIANLGELL